MEIVIIQIKNGWLLGYGQESVYCKDAAELHKELEFLIKAYDDKPVLPDAPMPPIAPTEKPQQQPRQFDDED